MPRSATTPTSTARCASSRSATGRAGAASSSAAYPATGNHDFATKDAQDYYDFFGERGGPFDEYYSYDLGAWHVAQRGLLGVLKLDLRTDGYDFEFLPVAGKSFTYRLRRCR